MPGLTLNLYTTAVEDDIQYNFDTKTLDVYLGTKADVSKIRSKLSEIKWQDYAEDEIEIVGHGFGEKQLTQIYEAVFLKSYLFDKYKTIASKKENKETTNGRVVKFTLRKQDKKGLAKDLLDSKDLRPKVAVLEAVKFCRDIVNMNASEINPGQMQRFARSLSAKDKKPGDLQGFERVSSANISVKVIDAKEAKKLGMESLLAVGAESLINAEQDFHPRLVILEYLQAGSKKVKKHTALVGKGITFDTGGLCLKPTKFMLDMKSDMAGSATVLSVFRALANLDAIGQGLKKGVKVTGVLALTENGFGASSYKPGDVLRACNGKTIQVVDTDAEGRLALADALAYLSRLHEDRPDEIIDLATLTGSIVATLGEVAAGAMTNDEKFFKAVNKAFAAQGENLWHMPLFEEYKKGIKSEIADMAHCSTRPDALHAGMFLKEFVDYEDGDETKEIDWLHLDIAGMGFWENDGIWADKGATGFGVRGLIEYLRMY